MVALTDTTNFRKSVMPSYKSHRLKTRKPVVYQALREYVQEVYKTYVRPGLEGDDILGILATHDHLISGEKVIVSIDKDLKTIPGVHMRLDDPERKLVVISREEADYHHMFQTLTGDTTDGYPGAPGFGPVKTTKLLAEGCVLQPHEKVISRGKNKGASEIVWLPGRPGTVWDIVVSAYASVGLGEEVALQNARVARILRASDYDFSKKEVKLWTATDTTP